MELMTWNPLREIDALLNRRRLSAAHAFDQDNYWMPAVDIREKK